MKHPPEELLDFLKKQDRYLIAMHRNPDGDAIGSASALALILRRLGKQTAVFCQDRVPEHYRFLPESAHVLSPEAFAENGQLIRHYEHLVLVDCNDLHRVTTHSGSGLLERNSWQKTLVIDHHATPSSFGDIRWIEADAAATGLMVLALADALDVPLTEAIATNLYAAMVVDTGNFRFENTSADVLYAAARLASAGANPTSVCRAIYESWSSGRLALFGKVLSTFEMIGSVALAFVNLQMFAETGTGPDDTETFVEFLKVNRDAEVALLIRELAPDNFKLSLRAKGTIDVAAVAAHFGGGGHKNAAGCEMRGSLASVKEQILKHLLR